MAEEKEAKTEDPEAARAELAKRVDEQTALVAKLVTQTEEDASSVPELELNRERDLLRHLKLTQKENPDERAEAKATYAAKAALSRAIQPVEDET